MSAKPIVLYLLPFLFHFLLPFCSLPQYLLLLRLRQTPPLPPATGMPHSVPKRTVAHFASGIVSQATRHPGGKNTLHARWFFCTFIFGIFTCENTLDACLQSLVRVVATWPGWARSWLPINCNYAAAWWEEEEEEGEGGERSRMWWKRGSARFGHAKCFGMCQPCG